MTRKPATEAPPPTREQLSLLAPLKEPAPLVPAAPPAPPVAVAPPPPLPAPVPPPAPRVYSVGEILRAARTTLESRFADVLVEGEVSGLKKSGPGHLYFCLKDGEASLDCVMFQREANRLKFAVKEGLAVRVRGRLTLYEARGKFQMTVVEIEPTGAGALALAFEQLKQRLGEAGLFDPARKRRLPFLPRRLGVVTSPQGAVVRDIIRIAHRRFPLPIVVSPAPVQGEGAALAIASALRRLEAVPDLDVVIVARGGGSLEDLWAFNEEPVARAIFACRVPVISAVGHETDFTIADFVADLRAPTPSAAAELAVPVLDEREAGHRQPAPPDQPRGQRVAARVSPRARAGARAAGRPAAAAGRAAPAPGRRRRAGPARAGQADGRGAAPSCGRRDAAAPRAPAPPHPRAAERAGVHAPPAGGGHPAGAGPAASRHRGGVRQAGRAVADPGARARVQPHAERRRPHRHARRRPEPGERVHIRLREGAFDAVVEGAAPATRSPPRRRRHGR